MAERWAIAPDGEGALVVPLRADGRPAAPVTREPALADAVRARPEADRWVWRATSEVYPALLAAGLRVERCYDIESAEGLLLGHEGRFGEPRSAAAAWARLTGAAVPPDPPLRPIDPSAQQTSLFDVQGPAVDFDALLEVYADQVRRHGRAVDPDRMRMLTAAESAGMLIAAEMDAAGLPWRADEHRRLLDELLGDRIAGGEPRRLTELADEVSAAFGRPVRPERSADVVKAFARAGVQIKSSRRWEIEAVDHPAVKPLLEYRTLYRIYTANGWAWLRDWVHDGRFRPGYLPGGTATGRWVTNGGGGLQIPKVIRRAVIADDGWRLVVADASQLEPRVLAAISRDPALMAVAGRPTDLYQEVSDTAFAGDRGQAKLAVLGAIYGQTSGDGLQNLATLRRRFPRAVQFVDDAARSGEEGRLVRTWLGRTCPPAHRPVEADLSEDAGRYAPGYSSSDARARGRFTRNFVVQGSAMDWALLMMASLRQQLAPMQAELVFFQHDEVIVHCPAAEADTVAAAIQHAGDQAGRICFGTTPVRFPFGIAAVESYADAK